MANGMSLEQLREGGFVVEGIYSDVHEVVLGNKEGTEWRQLTVKPFTMWDYAENGPSAPAETVFKPVKQSE